MKTDPKFNKLMRALVHVPKDEVQALSEAQEKKKARAAKKRPAKKR